MSHQRYRSKKCWLQRVLSYLCLCRTHSIPIITTTRIRNPTITFETMIAKTHKPSLTFTLRLFCLPPIHSPNRSHKPTYHHIYHCAHIPIQQMCSCHVQLCQHCISDLKDRDLASKVKVKNPRCHHAHDTTVGPRSPPHSHG